MVLHLYTLSFISLALLIRMGSKGIYKNIFMFIALPFITLLGIYSFLSHYSTIILSLTPYALILIFAKVQNRISKWKITVAILVAFLLWQVFPYISASAGYTSRKFFPDEIVDNIQSIEYTGIFFKAPVLFFLILTGSFYALKVKSRIVRLFSLGSLIHMFLMLITGAIWLFAGINWARYPSPHYLEQPAYPLYIISAVFGWHYFIREVYLHQKRFSIINTLLNKKSIIQSVGIIIIPLFLIGIKVRQNYFKTFQKANHEYRPIPDRDQFTKDIESLYSLKPGNNFKGYVSSIFNTKPTYHLLFWPRWATHWNQYSVQSLEEYSQTLSPQLYYFITRLFWKDRHYFHKNTIKLENINMKLLSMLGVKAVITDRKLKSTTPDRVEELPGGWIFIFQDPELRPEYNYVYVNKNANLGNYSPTRVIRVREVSKAISILKSATFDPQSQVIADLSLGRKKLSIADRVSLRFKKGVKISIQAYSPDYSLLIIPIQYSNCLRIDNIANKVTPILFRANLIETGIYFTGRLDAEIQLDIGLFEADCRIMDIHEMHELGIRSGKNDIILPGQHPHAIESLTEIPEKIKTFWSL